MNSIFVSSLKHVTDTRNNIVYEINTKPEQWVKDKIRTAQKNLDELYATGIQDYYCQREKLGDLLYLRNDTQCKLKYYRELLNKLK